MIADIVEIQKGRSMRSRYLTLVLTLGLFACGTYPITNETLQPFHGRFLGPADWPCTAIVTCDVRYQTCRVVLERPPRSRDINGTIVHLSEERLDVRMASGHSLFRARVERLNQDFYNIEVTEFLMQDSMPTQIATRSYCDDMLKAAN